MQIVGGGREMLLRSPQRLCSFHVAHFKSKTTNFLITLRLIEKGCGKDVKSLDDCGELSVGVDEGEVSIDRN